MTVVIVVPVLGRPDNVRPLLDSIAAATPEPHRTLFVCSPGDTAQHAAIDSAGVERLTITSEPGRGDYARKINHAYRATDEPFLFLGADDLRFHPGWLQQAIRSVRAGIGVVGTQDLGAPRVIAGKHATHSLVTRAYIDQYGTIDEAGKILHEGYWHEYVDDELVGTAKYRRAWVFNGKSVVEHLHPGWGKGVTDALYEQQKFRMHRSRPLFEQRKPLWGGR